MRFSGLILSSKSLLGISMGCFIACASPMANAKDATLKRITGIVGECRVQLAAEFAPCDKDVIWMELTNGRALLIFKKDKTLYTLSGGRDRQPNLEDFYLGIDTFRLAVDGVEKKADMKMEGECHFSINKDASKFYYIKCEIYNRAKGSRYNLYLENIVSFDRTEPK